MSIIAYDVKTCQNVSPLCLLQAELDLVGAEITYHLSQIESSTQKLRCAVRATLSPTEVLP